MKIIHSLCLHMKNEKYLTEDYEDDDIATVNNKTNQKQ